MFKDAVVMMNASCNASMVLSDRCMKAVEAYESGQSNDFDAVRLAVRRWVVLDAKYIEDMKECWSTVKAITKRVDGANPFNFPAGTCEEINKAIFLNKKVCVGRHVCQLQRFALESTKLDEAKRLELWLGVTSAERTRTLSLSLGSTIYDKIGNNSEPYND